MASLDDILTATKNAVTAINNGAQTMRIYANLAANANNGGALDQIVANNTTTKTAAITSTNGQS